MAGWAFHNQSPTMAEEMVSLRDRERQVLARMELSEIGRKAKATAAVAKEGHAQMPQIET